MKEDRSSKLIDLASITTSAFSKIVADTFAFVLVLLFIQKNWRTKRNARLRLLTQVGTVLRVVILRSTKETIQQIQKHKLLKALDLQIQCQYLLP